MGVVMLGRRWRASPTGSTGLSELPGPGCPRRPRSVGPRHRDLNRGLQMCRWSMSQSPTAILTAASALGHRAASEGGWGRRARGRDASSSRGINIHPTAKNPGQVLRGRSLGRQMSRSRPKLARIPSNSTPLLRRRRTCRRVPGLPAARARDQIASVRSLGAGRPVAIRIQIRTALLASSASRQAVDIWTVKKTAALGRLLPARPPVGLDRD